MNYKNILGAIYYIVELRRIKSFKKRNIYTLLFIFVTYLNFSLKMSILT